MEPGRAAIFMLEMNRSEPIAMQTIKSCLILLILKGTILTVQITSILGRMTTVNIPVETGQLSGVLLIRARICVIHALVRILSL